MSKLCLSVLFSLAAVAWNAESFAASGLPLLSGFDEQRVASCYPITDTKAAGEAAKLIYRLRKADPRALEELVADADGERNVGDVHRVSGVVESIRQYKVPENLVEFLELDVFQEIVLAPDEGTGTTSLLAPKMIGRVAKGDRVEAAALYVGSSIDGAVESLQYAAGKVSWFPGQSELVGVSMLIGAGVDATEIALSAKRNRRPLGPEDGELFYSMLSAARTIAGQTEIPDPVTLEPVELLSNAKAYHGQWIRIDATTVRITKVNVTDAVRRAQLGQDFYYQIDSSGDLGKTVIELKRPEGEPGDPIRMSGKYPLSLVSAELPDFLQETFDQQDTVVMMTSQAVRIDGFFCRLWSYRNEFMDREGGKQVGPLIVVSRWTSLEQPPRPDGEVAMLGYGLAIGIILAIVGIFFWSRRNAVSDAEARQRQQDSVEVSL